MPTLPGGGNPIGGFDNTGIFRWIETDSSGSLTTSGNVASGSTDSGDPVKIGGKYNLTPPTFSDGQRADAQVDANGNIKVAEATLGAGEDLSFTNDSVKGVTRVEQHYAGTNINSNTTTTVKSGAGFLHLININKKGATGNTATLYDSITGAGTVLGVIDTTDKTGPQQYDIVFTNGLTIVTSTGTAADLTVSSR